MLLRHFRKHFFAYTLVLFTTLAVGATYYRFMVTYDYLVSYEGDCDPYTQDCFLYCEDETCSDPFYYSIIERHAAEIRTLCGKDVTTCDEAYICQESVEICSFTYCDPLINEGECEMLTEEDYTNELNGGNDL